MFGLFLIPFVCESCTLKFVYFKRKVLPLVHQVRMTDTPKVNTAQMYKCGRQFADQNMYSMKCGWQYAFCRMLL